MKLVNLNCVTVSIDTVSSDSSLSGLHNFPGGPSLGAVSLAIDLLGPLRVSVGGRPLPLTADRLRVLLALLAMSPGRPVTMDGLATALWGEQQPENPRRSLQTYVTRLRTVLGDSWIGTGPHGYRLDVPPTAIDAMRFGRLLDAADNVDDPVRKRALLTEALELWRGEPFEDLDSPWLTAVEAPRLVERYVAAIEERADVDLADGRHEGLVAELRKLTQLHPLRESLWARLLVALARSGRPADALAAYETIRRHLAEELGTDPGAELKHIYADLLSGALARRAVPIKSPAVPRQLPAPPAHFTGRCAETTALEGAPGATGPLVTVVSGMAGVGKTALAVHIAHRMSAQFPDGQLFVDLRGHSYGREPIEPAEALDGMLRALGVASIDIPVPVDEKAALYRTCMAGRRVLVVLDDAASEKQVLPLLPGAPGSRVIITSRRRLGGLSSAQSIDLPALPVGDALALLRRAAGEQRLASAPRQDLVHLVRMCGRLPLAILNAASRLRAHHAWRSADLSARLALDEQRLAELEVRPTGVATALDVSYRHLSECSRRAYRLLGLHPGPDFDTGAAAALAGLPDAATRHLLDDLIDAHLLNEPRSGRYQFEDLVRLHAAALGRDEQADRAPSIDRLLSYYGLTATAAVGAVYPPDQALDPMPPLPQGGFPTAAAASRWLDAEMPNLLATALRAAEDRHPGHLLLLSGMLARHLMIRNRYSDAEKLHGRALTAALDLRDQPAQLIARLALGAVYHRQDRDQEAVDTLTDALRLARVIGDRDAVIDSLVSLGHSERKLRRLESATGHYRAALALAQKVGRQAAQVDALSGLGRAHLLQRRWRQALESFGQAAELSQSIDERARGLNAVSGLGDAYRLLGLHQPAEARYRRAFQIAEDVGDRNWQMESSHGLGLLYRATGQTGRSLEHHHAALRIATDLGHHADRARAHDGLAKASLCVARTADARRHWRHALDILLGISALTTEEGEVTVKAIRGNLAEKV